MSEPKTELAQYVPISQLAAQARKMERLTAANAALAAELRKVEWRDTRYAGICCPSCGGVKGSGHTRNCTLAAALALAEPPA